MWDSSLLARAISRLLTSKLQKVALFLEEKLRQKLGTGLVIAQRFFSLQDLVIGFDCERHHHRCLRVVSDVIWW